MAVMNDLVEEVILVDLSDREIGTGPKLDTHRSGLLHRAFSIFVFDRLGHTLVQRRADGKYHSAGLWANTCCGHPRPGEPIAQAAKRRLIEELGLEADLSEGFATHYMTDLDHGMKENEYVHVFGGVSDAAPVPEPTEVSEFAYISLEDLRAQTQSGMVQTVWLRHYLDNHFDELIAMRDACLRTAKASTS